MIQVSKESARLKRFQDKILHIISRIAMIQAESVNFKYFPGNGPSKFLYRILQIFLKNRNKLDLLCVSDEQDNLKLLVNKTELLNISEGTSKSQLFKARQMLQKKIKELNL